MSLRSKLEEIFGADLRSLALLRVSVGCLIIVDLILRSRDLVAHYTDDGVLPRTYLIERGSRWLISLHLINGTWEIQAVLFILAGLAALGLALGYKTCFATIASWVFCVSLNTRNPLVIAGDAAFRSLLFWGMFLPWGARFSLDYALNPLLQRLPDRHLSWGTIAFLLQIVFIFWFGALLKTGPEWRLEGSAAYYALSFDQWVTPLGRFLLGFPEFLKVLTFTVFWLEVIGPLLLFSPFWTGPVRTAGILLLWLMLVGIGLTMNIGTFLWLSAFALFGLLPTWFWQRSFALIDKAFPYRTGFIKLLKRLCWTGSTPLDSSDQGRAWGFGFWSASQLIPLAALIYVFLWNVGTLPSVAVRFSERFRSIGEMTGLEQKWNMFAPSPGRADGWYVIVGTLKSGQVVDLFRDGTAVSWQKPQSMSAMIKNFRWQKYLASLLAQENIALRPYYGRFLCRQWNNRHAGDRRVVELELFYMLETTRPDYEYSTPVKVSVFSHRCEDLDPESR